MSRASEDRTAEDEEPFPDAEEIHPNDPRYQRAKNRKNQGNANGEDEHIESLVPIDITGPITPRSWAFSDRVPMLNVTLIYGEGAVGKSLLLLHAGVCYALNGDKNQPIQRDWLGLIPEGGPVIYVSCEEDINEINRRLEDIAKFYRVKRSDFAKNFHAFSWVGEDSTMAEPNRKNGKLQPTNKFQQVYQYATSLGPRVLIILDTVADTFGGNENDRVQVRYFITMLRGLAIAAQGAILLAAHPSLSGISSDSGTSGSTAWTNSVRARAYFRRPKDIKDNDLRVLEWRKSNYGPISESELVRWKSGVYVLEPRSGSFEQQAAHARVDALFLALLKRYSSENRFVSASGGRNYAPTIFAEDQEAIDVKVDSDDFKASMNRLFKAGKIRLEQYGPPSKLRSRLVVV